MASNTVNISNTAVKMSNLRQSLNNFGDPISLGSARGQASSLPAAGSTISLSANCKNYINVYNPLLALDANNYQLVAPTTWSDNSGNNYNFTIGTNVYSNVNGVSYMNFSTTSASSSSGSNIPLTYANGATILSFSKINSVATNPRTLLGAITAAAQEYINPAAATYLQNSANWTNPTTATNTVTVLGYTYGNGTYIASASSIYTGSAGYYPWTIFKKLANQDWATAGSYYTGTNQLTAQTATGASTQMTVSGSTIYGEWVQIQLPTSIILGSYTYNGGDSTNSGQSPRDWIIAGSSDGSTWVNLDSRTGVGTIAAAFGLSATYTLTGNSTAYSYYRFIIRAVNSGGYAALSGWTLYSATVSGDKIVNINSSSNYVGIFDGVNASGFNPMTNPGVFDVSTIPSYSNTFNMLSVKLQTTSPYYQVKYNGQSASNYYTNNSTVNASLKSGIGYIGGSNNAENWGQVGLLLVYNSILPDTQITDIYNRFASRFYYNYPPVATNLIGYYTGDSWTGSQWSDLSGSGNHAVTVAGTIQTFNNIQYDNSAIAYQALNGQKYIGGGIGAGITFPSAILPQTYTLLWVARYAGINLSVGTGSGSNQRIFDATTSDWLSGFSGGLAGVAKHGTNWVTQNSGNIYGNNWIIGSDQTNLFRANSSNLTIANGVSGTYTLTVNNGFNKATQASDWMVATILVYSRELTTTELNTMEVWLAQKYNLTNYLLLHPLNQIAGGRLSCVGAFGLIKLNALYNGPIIKVRNGTNNSVMDFYSDIDGNLTIAPDGTGISLATWLGAATGYIDTWYDQSGNGNHGVQNALYDGTVYQPTIDTTNRMVSFKANSGTCRLKLPNGTVPSGDSSYSVIFKHNTITGTAFLGSGTAGTTNATNVFGTSGTNYNNYWFGNDATTSAGSLVVTGNVVTFKYTTGAYNNRVAFVNGTSQGVTFTGATAVRSGTTINNYIGFGDTTNNNYLNGELYSVYIFNTNISYAYQNILEQTPFYIAPLSGASASSVTTTSMTLSWTQTNGYQYTLISWNAGANTATVNYGTTTFSNFTAGNALAANTSYTFTLTPYYYLNTSGNSSTAATAKAAASSSATTITAVTLATVSGVSITGVAANSLTASWTAGTYTNVVVSWSPTTTGTPTSQFNAATYTTPTNLAYNTQYTLTVTPYNSASVAGTGVSAAATYTLAGPLTGQTATATISNSVATITWTDTNTPAATNYTITWSSGSGTSATKSFTTGTLSAGTYTFTITANNASGVGNSGATIVSNSVTVSAVVSALTTSPTAAVTDMQNTVVLLNFSGSHNGTVFTDSSPQNQQFAVNGKAILSSKIQPKFGATSGYFPGGSYIQSPANSINNLGNLNFTIEFWLNWTGVNQNPGYPQIIISNNNANLSAQSTQYSGVSYTGSATTNLVKNSWSIGLTDYSNTSSTKIAFTNYNQNPSVTITSLSTVQPFAWNHYAFVRNGTTISVFVNGILENQQYISPNYYIDDGISPTTLYVGTGFANQFYIGYMDDLRIMTNIAKYTATFTVQDDTIYDLYDYNVILLLHGNGANGSTTIVDSSVYNTTFTNTGTPQVTLSTTQSYFGGSCLYFSGGTTTVLKTATGSLYSFGASDFTIECWAYFTSLASAGRLFGNGQGSYVAGVWQINIRASTNFEFATYNGVCDVYYTGTTISTNTWYHLAVCRSGNTLYVWVNGNGTSGAISGSIDSQFGSNNLLCIGGDNFGDANMTGYLDEVCITKGLAKYTSAFQVPTAPYKPYLNGVLDDPVVILLHGEGTNGSTTIVDSSYYATQFGTSQGTPQISTTQYKFGTASLYVSSASLRTPTSSLYTFGEKDFTIEFWCYASTYVTTRFCGNLNTTFTTNAWYLGTNASSQILFAAFNTSPSTIVTTTSTVPINTWNHIALVRNGTTFMIFLNGILSAANNVSGILDGYAASRLSIGDAGENANYFNGYLDEFCITRAAKYTANFSVQNAPYLSAQPFDLLNASTILCLHGDDLNNSTGIIDSSYYQVQITNTNTRAVISTAQSMYGGSSIYFNGASSELVTPLSSLNVFGTGDWTIEFWLYYSVTQYCKLICNILSSGGSYAASGTFGTGKWYISIPAGVNAIAFGANALGGNTSWQTPNNTLALNQWQHVAVCRSSCNIYIFINGRLLLSNNNCTGNMENSNTTSQISIGTDRVDPYFNGYLDDICITRGIAKYTANFVVPSAPLQIYGAPIVVPITLLLHFDGLNGAGVLIDSSAINASITVSGAVITTSVTSPVSSATLSLTGSNNNYVATSSSLYYALAANNFTIEFWINATSISSTSYVLFNAAYSTAYAANMWRVGFNSTNNLQLSIWNISTNANVFITTNTAFLTGVWYHIAIVRNYNTFFIFINGQLDISGVTTASMDGGVASLICIGSIAASNSFTGYIDEFMLSVGYAKYSTNFTVPYIPINSVISQNDIPASATLLLLHGDVSPFVDSSQYATPITNNNSVGSNTGTTKFGAASMQFNNTNSNYLSLSSSLTYSFGTSDFTIEFWLNYGSLAGSNVAIMGNLQGSFTTNSWLILYYNSNSKISLLTNNQGNVYASVATTTTANTWTHFAFVRNGNALYVFINGTITSYSTYFSSNTSLDGGVSQPLYIGHGGGTDTKYTGYIDEIRITKGYALYTGNFVPPAAPFNPKQIYDIVPTPNVTLLLHADGTNGTITQVTDSSPYKNTVTPYLTATPSYNTSTYKFGTSSFYFNGYTNSVMNVLRTSVLPGFGSDDFTIEFWINISSFGTQMRYLGNVTPTSYYEIGHGAGGQPFMNTPLGLLLLSGVSTGVFTHIAFVRYSNKLYGYVNGTLSNSMNFPGSIDGGASYTIDIGGCGYNSGQPNACFTGYMDEIRITKGFAQYTSNFTVQTQPFSNGLPFSSSTVLLLHFEDSNGSMNFIDSSPYQNIITSNKYAQISTATSAFGGSSLYLPNNAGGYLQTATSVNNNFGTGDFTIEFWFNWSGTYSSTGSATQRMMANTNAAFAANAWVIGWDNNTNNGTAHIGFGAYNINTTSLVYVSKTVIVSNTWYHFALSRQGTSFYVFINGILESSYTSVTTAVDDGSTSRNIYIGGSPGDSQYWYGYMDEVRITKGIARYTASFALPVRQYMTYTSPFLTQSTPALYCPLDNLSNIALQNAKGLYAAFRLLSTYTGPIVNIRRGSDSVTLDFFADASGNLETFVNGYGMSITAWLQNATGYITTWYDQSGKGNHATQSTTASQPIINPYNKYIDFKTQANSFFNLPSGTVPQQKYYSVILRHSTTGNANTAIGSLLGAGANTANQGNYFYTNVSGVYTNSWISNDYSSLVKYSPGAVVSWIFGTQGSIGTATSGNTTLYINGFTGGAPTSRTGWAGVAGNETIGTNTPTSNPALNGELYFITIFNMALTDADRNTVEAIYGTNLNSGYPTSATVYPGYNTNAAYPLPSSTNLIANYDLSNSQSYSGNISPCCLDGLSLSAINSARGLYACYRLLTNWTGPVMNVRRSYDSILMDFYSDANGNLGTGYNGTGASLQSWLSGSLGYITIWYDQSGMGNHATQTATGSQPQYNANLKLLDFGLATNTNRFILPDGTFPSGDGSYSIILRHGKIYSMTGAVGLFGSGTPSANNTLCSLITAITGNSGLYRLYFYSNDADSTTQTINEGNIISYTYLTGAGTNSRKTYINGTLNVQNTPSAVRNSGTANNYIAYDESSNNNYLNGQLYYITIFSIVLSDNDRNIVENIGKYSCSTIVNDLSGNKNNLTFNSAPSLNYPLSINESVNNTSSSAVSQGSKLQDISNGFTLETVYQTKNVSTPINNLGNGTGVSSTTGSGAATTFGLQNPVEFPPSAMSGTGSTSQTTSITSSAYGNGTYTASCSASQTSYTPALAFNKVADSFGWQSTASVYSATSGVYNTTTYTTATNSGTYYGEWLQMQMPNLIFVTSYSLTCSTGGNTQFPYTWVMVASLDGSTWLLIDTRSSQICVTGQTITYNIERPGAYLYYRIIVNAIQRGNAAASAALITEMRFFGDIAQATYTTLNLLAHWDFSNINSYAGFGSTLNDLSGNQLHLSLSSTAAVSRNPPSMAWTTTRYGSVAYSTGFATAFTVEILIRIDDSDIATTSKWIFGYGLGYNTAGVISALSSSTQLQIYVSNAGYAYCTNFLQQGVWSHIVYTASQSGGSVIYNNGIAQTMTGNPSLSSAFPITSGGTLYFGIGNTTSSGFNGAIALTRVYNRALTASEVRLNYMSINGSTNPYSFATNTIVQDTFKLEYPPTSLGSATQIAGSGSQTNSLYPTNPVFSYFVSGQSYGNGQYYISASTQYNATTAESLLYLFNKVTTDQWTTFTNTYAGTNNAYSGTVYTIANGIMYMGEWVQIQLPNPINLHSYLLYTRTGYLTRGPNIFYVLGSNDGNIWTLVDSRTGITSWTTSGFTFTLNSVSQAFSYFRLVVNQLNGDSFLSLGEWYLYAKSNTISGTELQVTSFPALEFPPSSLATSVTGSNPYTTVITGQAYGNGTYVSSASSDRANNEAWRIFDKFMNGTGNGTSSWCTPSAKYQINSYIPCNYTAAITTTYNSTLSVSGEWLQIQLPTPIILYSYQYFTNANDGRESPYSTVLLASNDGSSWILIDKQPIILWNLSGSTQWQEKTFNINNPTEYYSYYRLVILMLNASNGGYATVGEWKLFGNPINNALSAFNNNNSGITTISPNVLEFPPAALSVNGTTTLSGQAYGNGPYTASASDTYSTSYAYQAFDKNTNNSWANNAFRFNTTTGNFANTVNTVISGVTYNGEWIKLQLPYAIVLNGYSMLIGNLQYPFTWYIGGSNDGTTWYLVDSRTGERFGESAINRTNYYTVQNNNNAYSYYIMVITNLPPNNANGGTGLGEWRLYSLITNSINYTNVSTGFANTANQGAITEYPPVALTTNTTTTITTAAYGNGAYTATASSTSGTQYPYYAFNKSSTNSAGTTWMTNSTPYNPANGYYSPTTSLTQYYTIVSNTPYYGEWLQIKMPVAIVLTGYLLQGRELASIAQSPASWYIAGSNDGISWVLLDSRANQVYTLGNQSYTYAVNNYSAYLYYRIIVANVQVSGSTGVLDIAQWRLYGYQLNPANTIIPVNSWTHGILTVSSVGKWTWYINGIPNVSGDGFMIPPNIAQYLAIGDYAGLDSICGSIALSRLYNRVLTTAQIAQNYAIVAKNYNITSQIFDVSGTNQVLTITPSVPNKSFEFPSVVSGANSIATIPGWTTTAGTAGVNMPYQTFEFPPAAMTADSCTLFTQTYVASASTEQAPGSTTNAVAFIAFNKVIDGNRWVSNASVYNTTSGAYTGAVSTTYNGTATVTGEWLQIQFPYQIVLTSYTFANSTNASPFIYMTPYTFTLVGSNNGTNWFYIDNRTGQSYSAVGQIYNYNVTSNKTAYSYYRVVINAIGGSNTYGQAEIAEWRLFGYPVGKMLLEFPPVALTAGTQTQGSGSLGFQAFNCTINNQIYGNGIYYTSATTTDQTNGTDAPWCAFNKVTGGAGNSTIWNATGPLYSTSSPFGYTGSQLTTISGTARGGEWLQIQLPSAISLASYSIQARSDTYATSQSPSEWYIAGSNDGSTWTQLDYQTGITSWASSSVFSYTINTNNTNYTYYRIVCTKVTSNNPSSGAYVAIGEWRLYGF